MGGPWKEVTGDEIRSDVPLNVSTITTNHPVLGEGGPRRVWSEEREREDLWVNAYSL